MKTYTQMAATFDCVTEFITSITKEDLESFKAAYQGQCKYLLKNSTPSLDYLADGLISKMEGNYDDAIRFIELYIDSSGTGGKEYGSMLAEIYRKSNQYEKAIESCNEYLQTDRADPDFLFQLAQAQFENGQIKEAKDSFKKVKEVWKNMDEINLKYSKYKAFESTLESS